MLKNRGKSESIRRDNRGAALMVAVVIIGVLMVFTFSLILVTYSLYSSQNKKAASKRNAEAANTLSIALAKELEGEDAQGRSDLWRYLRFNLCQEDTWPYYDPECPTGGHGAQEAFRYFDLNVNYLSKYFPNNTGTEEDPSSGLDGFPGSVKLCVYWMPPEEEMELDHSEVLVSTLKSAQKKVGLRLFIEVICDTASQTYVVKDRFHLTMSYFNLDNEEDELKHRILEAYAKMDVYNPVVGYSAEEAVHKINLTEKWIWEYDSRE